MTKPDEVWGENPTGLISETQAALAREIENYPEDIWDAANMVSAGWEMPGGVDHMSLTIEIAIAIMAEREACALMADTHAAMVSHPASSSTAEILAKMIRNRT
jgi:hypothetical protein